MGFEKEVEELRTYEGVKYSNPNEWDIIQEMCSSLERGDINNFNLCYSSYYSIVRNFGVHNQECFDLTKRLYYKFNNNSKKS